MADEIEALAWREEPQRDRHQLHYLVEGARSRRPQERFQLRERHFDRIEIGTVGRQKTEARADAFDRGLHLRLLVHREVVEYDDVAGPQRRREYLLDVGEKRGVVERAIEDRRGLQPVDAERRDDGVRLPVPTRRVVLQATAPKAPPVATEEIGRDARLVDEDVPARIMQRERVLPVSARGRDIRAPLFVGVDRFF